MFACMNANALALGTMSRLPMVSFGMLLCLGKLVVLHSVTRPTSMPVSSHSLKVPECELLVSGLATQSKTHPVLMKHASLQQPYPTHVDAYMPPFWLLEATSSLLQWLWYTQATQAIHQWGTFHTIQALGFQRLGEKLLWLLNVCKITRGISFFET